MNNLDIGLLVTGFKRPLLFEKAVKSLPNLGLPSETNRYAFIDGPRSNYGEEFEKNCLVRNLAKNLYQDGFLNHITLRKENLGTMENIYQSVSEVLKKHEFVFVLEDDLEILPLANGALLKLIYLMDKRINAFSLYCNKSYSNTVFCSNRYSSQGWGTRRIYWNKFNPKVIKKTNLSSLDIKKIKRKCGSDIYSEFINFKNGSIDSWAIPWNIHNFLNSNLMIYPPKSYILNNSHLYGAERTAGVKFDYEIAKENLQKKHLKEIFVNKKYISNFSILNRIKRSLNAMINKKFFKLINFLIN